MRDVIVSLLDFKQKRKIWILITLITIVIIAVLSIAIYKRSNVKINKGSSYHADYRMRIDGLRFYAMNDDNKVLAIFADSFVIEKKKIGFLTFSISYVARLENARFEFYLTSEKIGARIPAPSENNSENTRAVADHSTKSSLETVAIPFPKATATLSTGRAAPFGKDTFASFPVNIQNITAIESSPISIQFYDKEHPVSKITASIGELRFQQKDMRLSGNVLVKSGDSELQTEELSFIPEKLSLKTESPYRLKRGGTITSGKNLLIGIDLKPIRGN